VGYSLDEITNDMPARPRRVQANARLRRREVPRFASKFPSRPVLSSTMKSVGEVMAIGRTFGGGARQGCAR
jgi:carbamoyl-phosphate synthase large subunit